MANWPTVTEIVRRGRASGAPWKSLAHRARLEAAEHAALQQTASVTFWRGSDLTVNLEAGEMTLSRAHNVARDATPPLQEAHLDRP